MPFIFANFNGTQGDVEVVTHEAGHAFAAYTNRDRVPMSYVWPSMEACEVHSMSMEFLAWPWAENFFGPDTRKFLYSHLSAALTFIPYGTMVDHFQHLIYENPGWTPRERHDAWKKLLGEYMPWMKLDGEILSRRKITGTILAPIRLWLWNVQPATTVHPDYRHFPYMVDSHIEAAEERADGARAEIKRHDYTYRHEGVMLIRHNFVDSANHPC